MVSALLLTLLISGLMTETTGSEPGGDGGPSPPPPHSPPPPSGRGRGGGGPSPPPPTVSGGGGEGGEEGGGGGPPPSPSPSPAEGGEGGGVPSPPPPPSPPSPTPERGGGGGGGAASGCRPGPDYPPGLFCNICPLGWTWFQDRCYLSVGTELDWAEAEQYCISHGGNLASIHCQEEHAFIRSFIFQAAGNNRRIWVGGHDGIEEGIWQWSDGSRNDFTMWGPGEPNNLNTENCMEINFNEQDCVAHDVMCDRKNAFICKRHP